jgi:Ca2+-binding EF-hand superfamily protein
MAGADTETTDNAATETPTGSSTGTKFTYVQPANLAGDEKKMVIDARAAAFKQLDTDNDEIVEKDEFYNGLFAVMDANKDNAVNADELDREVAFWNKNGNPALHLFAQWDSDANKEISREEFRNKLAAVIDVPNGERLAQNLYVVWDTDNDDRIEMLELENVVIRFDADHN